jgi:glycosyltransferase involved in cell wall biosynthesis
MRDITVCTLIYRSTAYLDFVMNSLLAAKNLANDRVKYLIVCNDALPHVVEYAKQMAANNPLIEVVDHKNPNPADWWIQNVYRAWNRCLQACRTPYICFVNSDMAFTDGWLDALVKQNLNDVIPTSRLVESARMPSLPGLISKNLGQTIGSFDKEAFEKFAASVSENKISSGGAFMPSLFKTAVLRSIGGWSLNDGNIPGDQITFAKLRRSFELQHVMVHDSLVYHLQRGESAETGDLR